MLFADSLPHVSVAGFFVKNTHTFTYRYYANCNLLHYGK